MARVVRIMMGLPAACLVEGTLIANEALFEGHVDSTSTRITGSSVDKNCPCRVRLSANMVNIPPHKSLGDLVREVRIARSLSLREVAKRVRISPSYLSDIENDRRVPAEDVLRVLGKELDLDFDDLMARSGRLGHDAVRYMSKMPAAGVLFRQLSEENAPEEVLEKLLEKLSEIRQKERESRRTKADR